MGAIALTLSDPVAVVGVPAAGKVVSGNVPVVTSLANMDFLYLVEDVIRSVAERSVTAPGSVDRVSVSICYRATGEAVRGGEYTDSARVDNLSFVSKVFSSISVLFLDLFPGDDGVATGIADPTTAINGTVSVGCYMGLVLGTPRVCVFMKFPVDGGELRMFTTAGSVVECNAASVFTRQRGLRVGNMGIGVAVSLRMGAIGDRVATCGSEGAVVYLLPTHLDAAPSVCRGGPILSDVDRCAIVSGGDAEVFAKFASMFSMGRMGASPRMELPGTAEGVLPDGKVGRWVLALPASKGGEALGEGDDVMAGTDTNVVVVVLFLGGVGSTYLLCLRDIILSEWLSGGVCGGGAVLLSWYTAVCICVFFSRRL